MRVQKETVRHPFLALKAIIAQLVLENRQKNVRQEHTIHRWVLLTPSVSSLIYKIIFVISEIVSAVNEVLATSWRHYVYKRFWWYLNNYYISRFYHLLLLPAYFRMLEIQSWESLTHSIPECPVSLENQIYFILNLMTLTSLYASDLVFDWQVCLLTSIAYFSLYPYGLKPIFHNWK